MSLCPTEHNPARTLKRGVCLGIIGVLLGLVATQLWKSPDPDILLVVVDTLRADRMGAYGYPRQTSATLDRLSRRGVLFERAIVQASWTKPSMGSMLTGLYPAAHQALAGREMDLGTPLSIDPLPEELLTLPEVLQQSGYRTHCIQTNPNIKQEYGFAQGCDGYAYLDQQNPARSVTEIGLQWLRQQTGPAFLYLHYLEPHMPYAPPAPLDRTFTEGRESWQANLNLYTYRSIYDHLLNSTLGLTARDPSKEMLEPQLEHWKALYDAEIVTLDQGLAELFLQLERKPNTWLIVVADHGEQHLEHGSVGHGQMLYEELIRVPLIVVGPGAPAGRIVRDPVELVDLFPTVLEILGQANPELEGRSWLPLLHGGTAPARAVYAEVNDSHAAGARPLRTIAMGGFKVIDNEFLGPDVQEWYDLRQDPGELFPLPADRIGLRDRMLAELAERRRKDQAEAAKRPTPERVPLDTETLRQLMSLGYIQ